MVTSKVLPVKQVEDGSPSTEYEEALSLKSQRESRLNRMGILIAVITCLSWTLGYAGFSCAWVIILLSLLYSFWNGTFNHLVRDNLMYERLRLCKKRALPDESTVWLNLLLNKWWLFSENSLEALVKEHLEPLLNEQKPAFLDWIAVQHFTVGEQTPCIHSVRVCDIKPSENGHGNGHNRQQVSLLLHVSLACDDFRFVIRARLGSKGVGMDVDVAVEKLHIRGFLQATMYMHSDVSFPHLAKASLSFTEKPELWFSINVLNSVQMMEVPVIKTWLHTLVADAVNTSLVDPGKLDISLTGMDTFTPDSVGSNTLSQGVLTVTIMGLMSSNRNSSTDDRWCVLTIGTQKRISSTSSSQSNTFSFLVGNLATDVLRIKVKVRRFLGSLTVSKHSVVLSECDLEAKPVSEIVLQKRSSSSSVCLKLEYAPLVPLSVDTLSSSMSSFLDEFAPRLCAMSLQEKSSVERVLSGVLYICVHGLENTSGIANGNPEALASSNPYCIVFYNRKKVKSTPPVRYSRNVRWDTQFEVLVKDVAQTHLTFALCSYGDSTRSRVTQSSPSVSTDLIGLANLNLANEKVPGQPLIRKQLLLGLESGLQDTPVGILTVSVVFRPVNSMSESVFGDESNAVIRKRRPSAASLRNIFSSQANSQQSESLSNGFPRSDTIVKGLMELTIVRARDLVAMDLNGSSDPYCEVSVGGSLIFKTSVKKSTLQPDWLESVTSALPNENETLNISVWDKDPLGMRDYLGNVTLTYEDITRLSSSDNSEWVQLQGANSGKLELKCKIIVGNPHVDSGAITPLLSRKLPPRPAPPPIPTESASSSPVSLRRHTPRQQQSSLHHNPAINIISPSPRGVDNIASTLLHVANGNGDVRPESESETTSRKNSLSVHSGSISIASLQSSNPDSNHGASVSVAIADIHHSQASNGGVSPKRNSRITEVKSGSSHDLRSDDSKPAPSAKLKRYNSFKAVKQKVAKSLGQPLRRFRSETNMLENTVVAHNIPIDNSVSQEDINAGFQNDPSGDGSALDGRKASCSEKRKLTGVKGKVGRAIGIEARGQVTCRVKILPLANPPKTVAKSQSKPVTTTVDFDLEFQLGNVHSACSILVEIRDREKKTVAAYTSSLHMLLGEGTSVTKWIPMNAGLTVELQLSTGNEMSNSKSAIKLFRSLSVHRIGKF